MSEGERLSAFLAEAAAYFKNRPDCGEDKAYWANVFNAENCTKAGELITSLTTQLEAERERAVKAEAALREKAMEYLALDQQATEAVARAVKAEEHARNLRRLLSRYRKGTPLGHQPHMIAAEVDAALKTGAPSHD